MKLNSNSKIKAISFDVFDTLLLRNTKSEIQRFYEASKLHNKILKDKGYDYLDSEIFYLRCLCHKISYDSQRLMNNEPSSNIKKIFSLMLLRLNINDLSIINELIEKEIEYEKNNLRPNKKILNFIRMNKGLKIYFISDMYLFEDDIIRLIRHYYPGLTYNRLYSSADYNQTKNTGRLFSLFLKNESLLPEEVLHIGDDFYSDYIRPKRLKIASIYNPRNIFFRLIRVFNKIKFNLFKNDYL